MVIWFRGVSRTLLGAPGRTTRNKKLLGAPGIATRSKDATRGVIVSKFNTVRDCSSQKGGIDMMFRLAFGSESPSWGCS